jgi:putative transposase
VLINNGISIRMDGKGAWQDNIFLERFWRTVKSEEVYLHGYEDVGEARPWIARYIAFLTQCDPTSLLTAAPRIKPPSIRCRSARQLNPRADDPLRDAEILFKGPGPPHSSS